MNNIKRFAVALAIIAAFALVYAGFQGSDILDRAIVLGIGIDAEPGGEVTVTAEIVTPGNGSEEVGTYSKTVSAKGKSVVDALNSVSRYCGKEASLGQCSVVVFGRDYAQSADLPSCLKFLIRSESLKETCSVCMANGRAETVLNSSDAIGKSVSLSLAVKMLLQVKENGVPSGNLLRFCRSQAEGDGSGFLNVVTRIPTVNADDGTKAATEAVFGVSGIAVFKNELYLQDLTDVEAQGMAVLFKGVTGQLYVVEQDGYKMTLQVSKKDVSAVFDGKKILLKVKLVTRPLEADMKNQENDLAAKTKSIIKSESLRQVERQTVMLLNAFFQAQEENNFDLSGFHEAVRQKVGSSKQLFSTPTADLQYDFSVVATDD